MESFEQYHNLKEIGRGGMAVVYLADDVQAGREVVVKVLPLQFTHDPTFVSRFQREVRVLWQLKHPAIVPIYDYGRAGDMPFLVMPYLSGGTLKDRLGAAPMSVSAAVELLRPIAEALDYAHSQGVVHRDLKPANILFDERRAIFLADFGIVKMSGTSATITNGMPVGTPAYMSPEQISGDKTLDGRSDIYSLAIVLYELLSGALPYEADTPMQQLVQHVLAPVPNIRERRPDLAPMVEAALMRALAKEPTRRYATASALMDDLSGRTAMTIIEPAPGPSAATHIEPRPSRSSETVVDMIPYATPAVVARHAEASPVVAGYVPLAAPPFVPVQPALGAQAQSARRPPRRRSTWTWLLAGGALLLLAIVSTVLLAVFFSTSGVEAVAALLADTATATAQPTMLPTATEPQPTATPTEALPSATGTPAALPTETEPATATAPPPTATPLPTATPAPALTVTSASANVRAGPGLAYNTVGSLQQGQAAQVLERTADSAWYRVALPSGDTGWVSASVTIAANTTDLESAPVAASLPPPPEPTMIPLPTVDLCLFLPFCPP